ncbi:PQ-loop-domain-containing protein [Dentipellis sp. KUC8613]|nr:PQ-loop-domain-containing protein [Dentipellis sp. KUC8613]
MGSNDSLSSALGWISIACWIVVYSPQVLENYQLKSGEAVSVLFVAIWLVGDLCNLVGGVMAHLLPTVIILAVYYTFCDLVLLGQIYYYRWAGRRRSGKDTISDSPSAPVESHEETPLLSESHEHHLETKPSSTKRTVLVYATAVFFVFATGILAWAISEKFGHSEDDSERKEVLEWKSQVIGWISAVLYLGSRIPQIFKNLETKCEGLSPGLFLFSILGNLTYGLSICVSSMEKEHLIANASWLAGSLLTIFLDVVVLGQFIYYHKVREEYLASSVA